MTKTDDLTEVVMTHIPKCDLCSARAKYDARTIRKYWAYLCPKHFHLYGVGLGTGKGQKLIERAGDD